MSPQPSALRRAALRLMAHAVKTLPTSRSFWASAMANELDHVDTDREAVTWAAGCLLASYVERSKVMSLLEIWYVRALLSLFIATQVLSMLFATVLTAAYRLHYLAVAAFLGGFTPGDNYNRLIPLLDTTPWWIHALWLCSSLLFGMSAWSLLQNRRAAFPLFAAAWLLGSLGDFASQALPAYREVFSFTTPSFTRDYLLPSATLLLPLFIAAALWAHNRCSSQTSLAKPDAL